MSIPAVSAARGVERVWYGDDALARATRSALRPFGALYGLAVAARGRLFDAGILRIQDTELPALSVGNLTVGGTGKTPVSAWLAAKLRERGAFPAVVLRGYGEDEPLVHGVLNPEVPVVADPDRVAGIAEARRRGADVVVLDDAFQHRRARRAADVVLLSADRWHDGPRLLLPAGPWREPLSALRRASLVVVTRKAASASLAAGVVAAARAAAPGVPTAVVHLLPGELRPAPGADRATAASLPLAAIAGERVLAISAIGDARAFHSQLVAAGVRLDPPPEAFPDHYPFDTRDVASLVARAGRADRAVCTLKDAVKLAPHWPRAAPPLWYVSQRVAPEAGGEAVERMLDAVLAARGGRGRAEPPDHAGERRLTATDHGHRPPPADR